MSLASKQTEQVVSQSAIAGWDDPRGKGIFYVRPDTTGIWFKSNENGQEFLFIDGDPSHVNITKQGIYYFSNQYGITELPLMRFDFETAETEEITRFPLRPIHIYARWGLAISPDEQWILFSQVDKSESDLMLTEGVL